MFDGGDELCDGELCVVGAGAGALGGGATLELDELDDGLELTLLPLPLLVLLLEADGLDAAAEDWVDELCCD